MTAMKTTCNSGKLVFPNSTSQREFSEQCEREFSERFDTFRLPIPQYECCPGVVEVETCYDSSEELEADHRMGWGSHFAFYHFAIRFPTHR